MRAIMLTKTEKIIVILLVVVAIVNFYGNIYVPSSAYIYDSGVHLAQAAYVFWSIYGCIVEILVVAVLILMIRKG